MKKLLTICCTRGRPELFKRMLRSFNDTKVFSDLHVCLDIDDECLGDYITILEGIRYTIFDRQTTTEMINQVFELCDEYEFYSVTNDDMVYLTDKWDELMCNKGCITSCREPNMIAKHGKKAVGFPCISVIDSRIPKAVGWLQYPKLEHCCGDNVWYWISRRLKNKVYLDDVIIRHDHYYLLDKEKDDTYKRSCDMDRIRRDHKTFMNWLKYEIPEDLKKIKESLC